LRRPFAGLTGGFLTGAPLANKSANHITGLKLGNRAMSRAFNFPTHCRRQEKIGPTIADRSAQLHLKAIVCQRVFGNEQA
jgi:hypothetical protein